MVVTEDAWSGLEHRDAAGARDEGGRSQRDSRRSCHSRPRGKDLRTWPRVEAADW